MTEKPCSCSMVTCCRRHACAKCGEATGWSVPVSSWKGQPIFFGTPPTSAFFDGNVPRLRARLCRPCGQLVCRSGREKVAKLVRMIEGGTPVRIALKWTEGEGDQGIPTGVAWR